MSFIQDNLDVKTSTDVAQDCSAKLNLVSCKQGKLADHAMESQQPSIQTFRIPKDKRIFAALKKITAQWKQEASAREIRAQNLELPFAKQQSAVACSIIASVSSESFSVADHDSTDYIALNSSTNEVEGIAIVTINKECPKIERIGVRPSNIDLFPEDRPIRGTGTALITHIFEDLNLGDQKNKNLELNALYGSILFYEHIGFFHRLRGCILKAVGFIEIAKYENLGCIIDEKDSEAGFARMTISHSNLEKLSKEDQMTIKNNRSCLDLDEIDPDNVIPMAITAEKREAFLKNHQRSKTGVLTVSPELLH